MALGLRILLEEDSRSLIQDESKKIWNWSLWGKLNHQELKVQVMGRVECRGNLSPLVGNSLPKEYG
jgi:hypothetical protein